MVKCELKKFKIEVCLVECYKKLYIGMENKIMQLQCKVDEQNKDYKCFVEKLINLEGIYNFEIEKL